MSGREIVIIGAGGFGREVFQYAREAAKEGWPFRVVGFVDDRRDALDGFNLNVPVVGSTSSAKCLSSNVIVAVGEPRLRRTLAQRVLDSGGGLISLVHPDAYVPPTAALGDGVIVCPRVVVGAYAKVGDNVALNLFSMVGHDADIGAHSSISPYVAITGGVTLGEGVLLGTHCTVVPGVAIGSWSKVSVGCAVVRDAPAGSLLTGNPAKGRVMFADS